MCVCVPPSISSSFLLSRGRPHQRTSAPQVVVFVFVFVFVLLSLRSIVFSLRLVLARRSAFLRCDSQMKTQKWKKVSFVAAAFTGVARLRARCPLITCRNAGRKGVAKYPLPVVDQAGSNTEEVEGWRVSRSEKYIGRNFKRSRVGKTFFSFLLREKKLLSRA